MSVADALRARIAATGPIGVADYMAAANAHYYATRDPLGAAGDFTTAPEISQMFGELTGLWLADLWTRAGRPPAARYVELGPGRGTLAADALRAMRGAGLDPPIELVETSPVLRALQQEALPASRWHDGVDTLPAAAPLLVVANEFFDALPVRQMQFTGEGWRELVITWRDDMFLRVSGPSAVPPPVADAAPGTIVEDSPAIEVTVAALAARVGDRGGAVLIVDYGFDGCGTGDTLQAVSRHAAADPFADPGERDLTAHVDFAALAAVARRHGLNVWGPTPQGIWLRAMGIDLRAAALAKAAPERAGEVAAARRRLVDPQEMGTLFKVLALTHRDWPQPEGF